MSMWRSMRRHRDLHLHLHWHWCLHLLVMSSCNEGPLGVVSDALALLDAFGLGLVLFGHPLLPRLLLADHLRLRTIHYWPVTDFQNAYASSSWSVWGGQVHGLIGL